MGPQPSPPRFHGCLRAVVSALFVTLSLHAPSIEAQTGPRIRHDGMRCILSGEHLILEAMVEPADGLTTVKAYFRANLYTQFYYVEMVPAGNVYQGVLPKPSPEITGLHYYLEAMDSSFNSARTAEYTPQVVSDEASCRERNPTPAAYLDGAGAITVGSTGSGPAFPAGFLSEGIAGTIPAVGRATGGGSGLLIGGAAAAGAAVGIGVLVSGGDDSPENSTTTVPSGVTTTAATTSIPAATTTLPSGGVMACFETSPSPPRIGVGGSVRFDASCTEPPREEIRSYVWDFHDGRGGREGRVVNRVYNNPGTFGAVLTVTTLAGEQDTFEMDVMVEQGPLPPGGGGPGGPTTTVPGSADLQITSFTGPGAIGSGSNATYTVNYTSAGPDFDPSVSINTTFSAPSGTTFVSAPGCSAGGPPTSLNVFCAIGGLASGAGGSVTITVRFASADTYFLTTNIQGGTSDPAPGNNGRNLSVAVSLTAPPGSPGRINTRLTSSLDLPPGDGATQAQVTFNQSRSAVTDNSGPSTHEVPGRRGENSVEGFVTRNPSGEGVWRFDFRGAPGFVPGSFLVDTGQVVSRQTHEIVFRVAPGVRRIRFRYRLE